MIGGLKQPEEMIPTVEGSLRAGAGSVLHLGSQPGRAKPGFVRTKARSEVCALNLYTSWLLIKPADTGEHPR